MDVQSRVIHEEFGLGTVTEMLLAVACRARVSLLHCVHQCKTHRWFGLEASQSVGRIS